MKNKICKISLFSAILATVAAMPADSAVKTKNSNRSYADAYNQVNAMRYQQLYANETTATTASATDNLPVAVDNQQLANDILNNASSTTNISELEACSMIYPNGVFRWGIPESGVRKTQKDQCVAVVELRDANTNAVLATTTVAAGDTMKCNIDYFPQSGYNMSALSKVELPADEAPTMEDVEAVMNQEQKQNAGLKIAAGALIAGVAGNLLAPKEAGAKTGKIPLGTGKTQLIDTAVGAAAGAGIMAASTYSGKVAGDTIKSTAVNAASGMIVGNMLAGTNGGDGVLATVKCSVNNQEHDCIVGNTHTVGKEIEYGDNKNPLFYIISKTGTVLKCNKNDANNTLSYKCEQSPETLTNIVLEGGKRFDKIKDSDFSGLKGYIPNENDKSLFTQKNDDTNNNDLHFKIKSANKTGDQRHAYAVFPSGTLNKAMGYKTEDWDNLKTQAKLYARNSDGTVGNEITSKDDNTTIEFKPTTRGADSGGLIDMSNQARAKGTIVGTAAGGALGGLAGYEGAKTELSERWAAASIEYNDSLSNFVCATGGRFLSQYNSYVEISEPVKSQQ